MALTLNFYFLYLFISRHQPVSEKLLARQDVLKNNYSMAILRQTIIFEYQTEPFQPLVDFSRRVVSKIWLKIYVKQIHWNIKILDNETITLSSI